MIPSLAFLATLTPGAFVAEPVTLKLIPSGAVEKTGGYRPIRAALGDEVVGPPLKDFPAARYGTIVSGTKKIAFALSEPEGQEAKLIVDTNGNGDLTDDKPADWKAQTQNGMTIFVGGATVDIGKDVPVRINMYRFDPKDPQRAAMKDTLLYYYDYGYEMSYKLDGKSYTNFVAGEPAEGMPLSIDRNGDGKISYTKEIATIGKPFNFTGTTYVFKAAPTGLALEKAAEKLPVAPMPPEIAIGKKALPIKGNALDGKPLDLMKDYKGKLVMVDFWATWCGPCLGELPNVKAAYAANKAKGFDVLGISFDQANMGDKLKEFVVKNEMPWRHAYEGKYWNTQVGTDYDVSAIPFTLLVDGDTGKIVAMGDEMRGPGLSDFIAKKLAEKKGKK